MNYEYELSDMEYSSEVLSTEQLAPLISKLQNRKEPWFVLQSADELTVVAPSEDITFTSTSYYLVTFKENISHGRKPEFFFRVTEALASANLALVPFTSFNHLHVLINAEDRLVAEKALKSIKVVK